MKIAGKEINFKPEFGNQNHVKICDLLASIDRDTKKLLDQKTDTTSIKKRLSDDKKEVIALLKQDRFQKQATKFRPMKL